MKKKFQNSIRIEGYVYQHTLEEKTVQNKTSENFGKPFINGSVWVATDEDGLNVVEVHYSYVTPMTKKNTENTTYKNLKKIMEGATWVADGKENALRVILSPTIALNDFFDKDDKPVAAKRAEGGFVTICTPKDVFNSDESKRSAFDVEMLITSVKMVDADEEKGYDAYAEVRGCVFDFRNAVLPVDFRIRDPKGMDYMLDLGATPAEPKALRLWGKIISETTTVEVTEESAWGEALVKQVQRNHKEWLITGSKETENEFGDEELITADELKAKMQEREVYLATVKKRADDYKAQKAGGAAPAAAPVVAETGFNF